MGAPGRLLPAADSEWQGGGRRLWARERDGRERSGEQWRGTKKKKCKGGEKIFKKRWSRRGEVLPT